MAAAGIAAIPDEFLELLLDHAVVRLCPDRLNADLHSESEGAEATQPVDDQSAVRTPGIGTAELLPGILVFEIVQEGEHALVRIVLASGEVLDLAQGFVGGAGDELGSLRESGESSSAGLDELELMPMEVRRDWFASVGEVAEEGLMAGLEGEEEDFYAGLDQGPDGMGLACSARTFEENVNSGEE